MQVDVLTLFPEMFGGFQSCGIIRIAQEKGLLDLRVSNFRDFARDRHKSVDDRPYGGGPGMVLMCGPIFDAVEQVEAEGPEPRRVLLTPQGRPLTQPLLEELSQERRLLLLCGHYEGYDERIRVGLKPLEVSVGDYVLTGGELPAMTLIDGVTRLIPGVLGHAESARDDSFAREDGGLEGPQYTRPREFRGLKVPDVLLSGDHGRIAAWRSEQGRQRTKQRRPELLSDGGGEEK